METVNFCKKNYYACAKKIREWAEADKRCFIIKEFNSLIFDYFFPAMHRWKQVLLIGFFSLLIWMAGVSLLDFSFLPFWDKFFLDRSQLENIFAPVAAFFSGLSAIATSYLIYLQMRTIEKSEHENKKLSFERHFFLMFKLRNEIVNSLRFEHADILQPVEGKNNFVFFYNVSHKLFTDFFGTNRVVKRYVSGKNVEAEKIADGIAQRHEIRDLLQLEWNDPEFQAVSPAFRSIMTAISENNFHLFSPYYHNIYATLKMICENTTINDDEKDNYMRLFRAQLSQHEFMLIYMHALSYKDRHDNKYKFKSLIEGTCFFHSLLSEFIFIESKDKNFKMIYDESAFEHVRALR